MPDGTLAEEEETSEPTPTVSTSTTILEATYDLTQDITGSSCTATYPAFSGSTLSYKSNNGDGYIQISSDGILKFTTTEKMKMTIICHSSASCTSVKIDGSTSATSITLDSNKSFGLTFDAGEHSIGKGNGNLYITSIKFEKAN